MNRRASLLLFAVFVGIVIGAVAALRFVQIDRSDQMAAESIPASLSAQSTDKGANEFESEEVSAALASLTKTLNEEIETRRLLAQQVEQLQAEVKTLQADGRAIFDAQTLSRNRSIEERERLYSEFGFTSEDRETIDRLNKAALIRGIELDDRARREGWIGTSRYNEELEALQTYNDPVRLELGDARYDQYLYAAGRSNRVVVGSVIEGSEAQKAGLQNGDIVVRYGGAPVFSNLELVNLRSSGEGGAPVIVDIIRNGQAMQFTMPRGPMGFSGNLVSIDPRTNTAD